MAALDDYEKQQRDAQDELSKFAIEGDGQKDELVNNAELIERLCDALMQTPSMQNEQATALKLRAEWQRIKESYGAQRDWTELTERQLAHMMASMNTLITVLAEAHNTMVVYSLLRSGRSE
jgi:hypothetical protein